MYHGGAIVYPLPGALRAAQSVNHGSGRVMGRGQAKRELAAVQDIVDEEMRTVKRVLGGVEIVGIASNCPRTPLDECGHAYKNLDDVLGVLETEGIARIERRLWPVANLKGMD